MKRFLALLAVICAAAIYLSIETTKPGIAPARPEQISPTPSADEVPAASLPPEKPVASKAHGIVDEDSLLHSRADIRWQQKLPQPALEAFRDWSLRYVEAKPETKKAMEPAGIALAATRRGEMLALMQSDPQYAVERAIPVTVWRQMPPLVRAHLETRVDTKADVLVEARRPMPGKKVAPIALTALIGTESFPAFGEARTITKFGIPVSGISLSAQDTPGIRMVALSKYAGRVMEPVEVAEAKAQNGGETVCETSGQSSTITNTEVAINSGGNADFFCGPAHAFAALDGNSQIALAPPIAEAGYQSTGDRKILIYRVDFSDYQGQRVDEGTLNTLITNLRSFWDEMSYGSFRWVAPVANGSRVTPVLRLPLTSDNYTNLGTFLGACRTAARAAGIEPNDFDFDMVVTAAKPSASFGGVGYVGWKGCWLANSQWNLSVGSHELGHNVGLNHANYWDVPGSDPIDDAGSSVEYGDSYDIMGTGGNDTRRHFNVREKNYLGWAPNSSIHTAGATGTYRIYAMDKKSTGTANQKRGIKIDRLNSGDDWWIDYRQLYAASNNNAKNGVWLHWGGTGNQKTNLIDLNPGGTKDDSTLLIGKTFKDESDSANPIYITPLARGNTDPDWVDVRISQGGGLNQPPTVSMAATNTTPAANVNTTITATVTDPDGDKSISYFWDMGDGSSVTNNSPTITYKYPTNGNRTVRCTASDGRGGTATGSIIIKVGGQTSFSITGTVRNVSGNPMEGVTVSAGGNRTDLTDDSGNYVITNLPAASYTLTATKPGLTINLSSGISNPVTVGPDRSGINFTVAPGVPSLGSMKPAIADAGSNTGDITLPLTDPDTPLTNITLTGTSSNTSLIPNANIAFGTRGTARTCRVTAPSNKTGTATITITARDPQNNQTTTTWTVTVNNNPTITGTTLTTGQNTPVEIDLRTLVTDDNVANSVLAFELSRVIGGTAMLLPDGYTARFTPLPGYQGAASFRATARDQSLSSRLVLLYDFEPPDVTTDGRTSDRGNYNLDGTLNIVGTSEYNYRNEVPAQLAPFSTKSLSFSDNGLDSSARLIRTIPVTDLDFSTNSTGWSFSAWVNRRSNKSDDFIFHIGAGDGFGPEDELQLYFPENQNTVVLAKYGANGLITGFTADNVAPGEWHHVAVTCTIPSAGQGAFSLYLDGFLVGTTDPVPIAFSQTSAVVFGGHPSSANPGRWFDGSLDDVSIYSNVLPHSDVAGLARLGTRHYLGQAATATINVNIAGNNDAPVVQPIANRRVPSGADADSVGVFVSDAETSARDLTVTAESSNQALVSNSNLILIPPSPWNSNDVGAVGAAGSTSEAAGTLTVRGSGSRLDGTQDEFRFVHLPMTDDGEVIARVVSMDYTHQEGRSGIMFRAGTTDNAVFAFIGVGPGSSAIFQARLATGVSTTTVAEIPRIPMPRWLRLKREGSTVSAYQAPDNGGVRGDWVLVGTQQMSFLPQTVNAGVAVNSHVKATTATALFDNITGDIANGAKRKLIILPTGGVAGSTTITVSVSDGSLSSSTTFNFSTNTAPSISPVADQGLAQGTLSAAIPVTVGDEETDASAISLTGTSSNQSIIADAGISITGSGADRSITLQAKPGVKGLVEITLTANDGQLSSTRKFRVFVAPVGTIVVNVQGFGAVSGYFGESIQTPGRPISISAKAVSGQAFRGWRGVISTYDPKITFTMPDVMYLEAIFEPSPYPRQSGTWNGLVLNDPRTHARTGGIVTSVNAAGAYSGKLTYAGKTWPFRGILHTDGTAADATITRKDLAPLVISFKWDGVQHLMTGVVTEGTGSSAFVAHHALFTSSLRPQGSQRPLPIAWLGKVTALMAADPIGGPIGSGYAAGSVSGSGSVKLSGKFADGTPFTSSAFLSITGDLPFHVPLYKGLGSATGWLIWRNLPTTDFTGSVTTFRPANPSDPTFSTGWPDGATLNLTGSYFNSPHAARTGQPEIPLFTALPTDDADGNAVLTLDGAGYISVTLELHISSLGKLTLGPLPDGEKFKLSLQTTTGLISGTVSSGGKAIRLGGAVLQKSRTAGGFTITTGAAGLFSVDLAE